MKQYKTNTKHYQQFKKYCMQYRKELGLTAYRFYFKHQRIGAFANCTPNHSGYVATIKLGIDWDDTPITTSEIKATAFHEVLHVLIGRIRYLGSERYITEEQIFQEEERVVSTLENFFSKA